MQERGFSSENFARFHPGGSLGRGLKLRVADLMRTGNRLATVPESATVRDAMAAITAAQSGAAVVTNENGQLAGYFTDGDIRRLLLRDENALESAVEIIMTRTPLALGPQTSAIEALRALRERGVDDAPVVDENNKPVGVLDVQELMRAGVL
jgi:arabinose-5-phosphate isomerase